jgi:hypothetical protein
MTPSDAPSCGLTYNYYSDNSRGVIYDCKTLQIKRPLVFLPKLQIAPVCQLKSSVDFRIELPS